MAFDSPLESDRVDDLNLFAMLIRAPVLGTLMWILGGNSARKEEEEQRRRQDNHSFTEGNTKNSDSSSSLPASLRSSKNRPRKSALKKSQPSMIGWEASELGDMCDPLGNSGASALDDLNIPTSTSSSSCKNPSMRKKELSWSDESGHQLANYGDEVRISNASLVWVCGEICLFRFDTRLALYGYHYGALFSLLERFVHSLLIVERFISVMIEL